MAKTDGREIVREHQAILDAMRGADHMVHAGEQSYCTCHCGEYIVTPDVHEADKFCLRHWVACKK
jgi:hypothetical protein